MKNLAFVIVLALLFFSCGNTETAQQNQTLSVPLKTTSAAPSDTNLEKEYHPEIKQYIAQVITNFDSIDPERKKQLKKLALYVQSKITSGEEAKLIYICTHNSRRSHMSQLWGMVAADYYGVEGLSTYSGGTEATAFNPRTVACLQRAGFTIKPTTEGDNPIYNVSFTNRIPAIEAFSKKYTHPVNPKENFAAVMTCSHADKNCPTVEGASIRLAIPYIDPKVSDNTPEEAATYDERCRQIATEEFYLFSQVNQG